MDVSCLGILGQQPHIQQRHWQMQSQVLVPVLSLIFSLWTRKSCISAPALWGLLPRQMWSLKTSHRAEENFQGHSNFLPTPGNWPLSPSSPIGLAAFRAPMLSCSVLSSKEILSWALGWAGAHWLGAGISFWGNMWVKWFLLPSGLWSIPWKSQRPPTRKNRAGACNWVAQERLKDLRYG